MVAACSCIAAARSCATAARSRARRSRILKGTRPGYSYAASGGMAPRASRVRPPAGATRAAGQIGEASRVAAVGCGTGTIARWMAQRLGREGSVDAVDIADEQVKVARSTAAPTGAARIRYQVGSAYEPGLPEQSYDVVFCRLVLVDMDFERHPYHAVLLVLRVLSGRGGIPVRCAHRGRLRRRPPVARVDNGCWAGYGRGL